MTRHSCPPSFLQSVRGDQSIVQLPESRAPRRSRTRQIVIMCGQGHHIACSECAVLVLRIIFDTIVGLPVPVTDANFISAPNKAHSLYNSHYLALSLLLPPLPGCIHKLKQIVHIHNPVQPSRPSFFLAGWCRPLTFDVEFSASTVVVVENSFSSMG